MTINEYRDKYNENKLVLDKLYLLLKDNKEFKEFSKSTILSSIQKIEEEQIFYMKKIKKIINSKYAKKMNLICKKELQSQDFITSGNEIIIQPDSVNNYICDVIEEKKDPSYDDITEVLTSDKKKDPSCDDTTEILTSDMKKKNPSCDDITEVLTSDKKESVKSKNEFPDARIVFDGNYKIIYDNGKIFTEPLNNTILEYNYEQKKSSSNFNIIKMLKNFDELNNSNMYERYMNNELEVSYDLSKLSNSKEDKRISKNIVSIAKRELKYNDKVSIHKKSKLNKIKVGVSSVAAAALLLIGGMGINAKLQKSKSFDKTNDTYSESTTEDLTEELTTVSDVELSTTEEEVLIENNKTDVKTSVETDSKPEIQSEEQEETDLRIGDIVSLENTDLYYSSTDIIPNGNTSKLNNNYKATVFSVVYQNKVMEIVSDKSISIIDFENACKDKYGNDVKIYANFDVLDYNNNKVSDYVGWINIDDVKTKSKVLK